MRTPVYDELTRSETVLLCTSLGSLTLVILTALF